MFLNSMICTHGFLYWIWGMLKNTNFLERKRKGHTGWPVVSAAGAARASPGVFAGAALAPAPARAHLAPSLSSPAVL